MWRSRRWLPKSADARWTRATRRAAQKRPGSSDRTDRAANARRPRSAASLDRASAGSGRSRSVSRNQAGYWTSVARRSALRLFYDVITPAADGSRSAGHRKKMKQIASKNLGYRREEISKAEALRVFSERDEPLKCELIDEKAGEQVSVYYIDGSPFIDFCLGPHVPNTNKLRALNCFRSPARTGKAMPRSRRCSASTARLSLRRKSSTRG